MQQMTFVAVGGLVAGLAGSILWSAFWTILVPEAFSISWAGHDALIVPIFFITGIGAAVTLMLSILRQ